ncbi:nuclear protein Tc22 [Trypanosoma rangeli]|uniref:Nuclear protein Tc22 n=1 Tax=Trypanosoma rangeli TaxID=5698 RepID=A0A3R7N649_TRYRA|nr:nuclear protein Tc22 [Trypanosoma rangeli]RNF00857.1 nuclear protein Tc22 [Trypanosoma rangeli]|eukprot:RNF00857.1 nuclear protein Tc22 [Trypanosoma rangeli]
MVQGGVVEIPPDFVPLEHVCRAMRNADCRTPVIFFYEDGDPFLSLCKIAKEVQSVVWHFDLVLMKSIQNAMDYVDVGTQNGDWVLITHCEEAEQSLFRDIALRVFLLKPEPKKYPRREFFRCLFCVDKAFDIEGTAKLPFPPVILKNSIIARRIGDHSSKWSVKLPSDAKYLEIAALKRERRREAGRDSDSETDLSEDEKLSGMWFYRSVELNNAVDDSPLTRAEEEMQIALDEEDVDTIKRLITDGKIGVSKIIKWGMTPLQYACSRENVKAAKCLLDCGADPNQPRQSDGCPPIFMSLEDASLVEALVEHGADLFQTYQGWRIDAHPDTSPHIARMTRRMRANM